MAAANCAAWRRAYAPWAESAQARGSAAPVVLALGEVRGGVDIALSAAAAIAGTVVDTAGAPQAGVLVLGEQVVGDSARQAITAADGGFVISKLSAPGRYRLAVKAAARATVGLPLAIPEPLVVLRAGQARAEGIRLVVRRDHLRISGWVVDEHGAPPAEVRVVALRSDSGLPLLPWNDAWSDNPSALSDDEGRFEIREVDAGRYALQARAADGAEGLVAAVAAGAEAVVLRLTAAGGIDGSVGGFRQAPEVLTVRTVAGRYFPPLRALVTGDRFQLRGLSAGTYQVKTHAAGEGDAVQVEVQAGGMAQVTGRAVDFRTGQAVAGVRCVGWLRSGLRRSIDFLPGAAWTDEDGRFELALPAGDTSRMASRRWRCRRGRWVRSRCRSYASAAMAIWILGGCSRTPRCASSGWRGSHRAAERRGRAWWWATQWSRWMGSRWST